MRSNRTASISVIVVLAATIATAATAAQNTNAGVPQGKAIGYWTQARLDAAQPLELVVDESTGVGKLRISAQAGRSSTKTTSGSTTKVTRLQLLLRTL